jgi:pilus assembly protein CpaF
MSAELRALVFEHPELADLDPGARRLALRDLLAEAGRPDDLARLADSIDGLGPLAPLLRDEATTDVLVNGPTEVWIERAGRLLRAPVAFDSRAELWALVERLVGDAGGRIDAGEPVATARLPDGARLHAVLPPVAPDGPLLSLRRHAAPAFDLATLVAWGALDPDQAAELEAAVRARRTIAVVGATGTGKTTLLNSLLAMVGEDERVVTIEEVPELRPRCPHVVSLVARPPNLEGRGAVGLDRLLREALRMRPDRIVIGEVRGAEARPALSALGTGHAGSMLTLHARSAADAVRRLTTLALQDPLGPSEASLLDEARRALDVVVSMGREGSLRRIVEIVELA